MKFNALYRYSTAAWEQAHQVGLHPHPGVRWVTRTILAVIN
jgi:hypothetical protein